MKIKMLFTLVAFLGSLSCGICQSQLESVDPKAIILKSIDAMGGEKLIRTIKTLYTEMETKMEGRSVTWVTKEMLPNMGAFQIVFQNRVVYEDWFNGKRGYSLSNGKVTEMDSKDLADKFIRRNIFSELDFINSDLYKLEYVSEAKVGSSICYKIKATSEIGDIRFLYIDRISYLTVKDERFKKGESDPISVNYYTDFKRYGELVFYSLLIMGDGPGSQKARLTKLVYNEGISREDFDRVK